jgi:putative sporulation protein YtxC
VIENLQIRYLINVLRQEYFFLQEKTQCEILIKTLKLLWYGKNENKNDILLCKKDVSKRLNSCFSESDDKELVLEGFMRFRMKDYLEKWESVLKKNVDEYVMEKEYKEFIGVLRYFVLLREPKEITIHLYYNEREGYELSDAHRNRITDDGLSGTKSPVRNKMTKEDVVLSALINISPEKIIIHNSKDITEKRLLMTIKNVFLDRVVFED